MNKSLFIFLLLFFLQSKGSQDPERIDFIYGNWGICVSSTTTCNPPDFLICKHDVTFYSDGRYYIFYNKVRVGSGFFTIERHPNTFKREYYKINFEEDDIENEVYLSDYFPNTSVVFTIKGAIVFMDSETYDPATVYFLRKTWK